MQTVGFSGDSHLGGEDFDSRLYSYFVKRFKKKRGIDISNQHENVARALRRKLMAAKRALSYQVTTGIELEIEGTVYDEIISRAAFEYINRDLFKKAIKHLQNVHSETGVPISPTDEKEIVMIGGSANIPKLQEMVKKFYSGKEPNRGISPDRAIAYGAAVQGGILSGQGGEEVKDVLLLDVSPLSLGVARANGKMLTIIKRNSVIPTKKTIVVPVTDLPIDSAGRCVVYVFEGERVNSAKNHKLGIMEGLPCPPGSNVEISFEIDANGVLKIVLENDFAGATEELIITAEDGRLSEEDIERMIREAEEFADEEDLSITQDFAALTQHKLLTRPKVKIRKDFREAIVTTQVPIPAGAGSKASVHVTMPDAITSWQVTAVVAEDEQLQIAKLAHPVVVSNPVSSSTVTPPFMTLGDRVQVVTIVENTLQDQWLRGVTMSVQFNARLVVSCPQNAIDCTAASARLPDIAPGGKALTSWVVQAVSVGAASLNTTLSVPSLNYREVSSLQTPLYIGPAGVPTVATFRGHVSQQDDFIVNYEFSPDVVYADAVVNVVLPTPRTFALEGVAALARYPYGKKSA